MSVFLYCSTYLQCCSRWGEGDSGGTCYDRRRAEALGPVRNPVLQDRVAPLLSWFQPLPNHQPIGGSDPNHQGICSPPRAELCIPGYQCAVTDVQFVCVSSSVLIPVKFKFSRVEGLEISLTQPGWWPAL